MTVAGVIVRPALRVEGRLNSGDFRSEARQHFRQHMIRTDQDTAIFDCGGHVTIAKVPGKTCQVMCVLCLDDEQRLRLGANFDDASIVQHKPVAISERDCLRQIEQEFDTALALHRQPPAVTIIVGEHNGISRDAAPMPGVNDLIGANHSALPG